MNVARTYKQPTSYRRVQTAAAAMRRAGTPDAVVGLTRMKMIKVVTLRYYRANLYRQSVVIPERLRHELESVAARVLKRFPFVAGLTTQRRGRAVVSARRVFVRAARLGTCASYPELAMYLRRPGRHSSLIFMFKAATEDEIKLADVIAKATVRDRKLELRRRK